MGRRGPEIGRARPFESANALGTTQVPSSGVQARRGRPRGAEDASSAARTQRLSKRDTPRLGEAWEDRVPEQSLIRRQRTVKILPSVIVAPDPPPPPPPSEPPASARQTIDPVPVRERLERLERMAPTQYCPRAHAVITARSKSAGVEPRTVLLLLIVSIAVFAVGITTLLLTTPIR